MIALLAKFFIRDSKNYASPYVRTGYGVLCGAVGIALNLLLFTGKLIAGTISGSIAVTADAFNNLSDAGSSIVTLVGFRLAGHKADSEHPFGHGRIEYVAGLVVSMAILLMAFELGKTSVEKILTPVSVAWSGLTAGVLVASILVKLYMFFYNRRIGTYIDSAAMRATAMDSLSDTAGTAAVLLSQLIDKWTGAAIDGYAGLVVAGFILLTGLRAAKETISPLLGEPPSKDFTDRIEGLVLSCPDIIGVHDLLVHNYGPGRTMISLHAEVPADGNLLALHDAVDNVERKLRSMLGCSAVIHMDPVVRGDERANQLHAAVEEIARGVDGRLTIHDFRIVSGPTHTNLVFDVAAPYDVPFTDAALKSRIRDAVTALDGSLYAVIEVDRSNETDSIQKEGEHE